MPNLVGIGLSQVPTNSMLGGLAYQDPEHASIKNLDLKNLSQINSEIADTAVDVFIYDTSKDSDGGAWRKRTTHTSWYNETLGTATRGTRREFPAVAVIVTTLDDVIIYDGDDPDLPMWMVFLSGPNSSNERLLRYSTNNASKMLNAILCVSTNDTLAYISFIDEYHNLYHSSTSYYFPGRTGIVDRNILIGEPTNNGGYGVGSSNTNDVAMTVLPNAPIDSATGLRVPTIAVATQQGISIITDSGTVYDLTPESTAGYSAVKDFMQVDFTKGNHIVFTDRQTASGYSNVIYLPFYNYDQDLTDPYSALPGSFNYTWDSPIRSTSTQVGEWKPQNVGEEWNHLTTCSDSFVVANGDTTTGIGGIVKIGTIPNQLMVNRITKDYNTGWAYGLTQGIFLSDTDDTNKTNGQTDPDRSHNNNALTVYGTITKSAVATGADLVAYSGFSGSNYLEKNITAINFGTSGKISFTGWVKQSGASNYSYITSITGSTNGNPVGMALLSSSGNFYVYEGTDVKQSSTSISDGNWHHCVGIVDGTTVRGYVDGREVLNTTGTATNLSSIDKFAVGHFATNARDYPNLGSLALVRISASIPTAEQIKKMYNDEKVLFQENAKATLYGSTDAVTALAYDEVTDQLYIGTSSGRSDFQGLCRINNTTTAVTTAISAHDEFIIEQ